MSKLNIVVVGLLSVSFSTLAMAEEVKVFQSGQSPVSVTNVNSNKSLSGPFAGIQDEKTLVSRVINFVNMNQGSMGLKSLGHADLSARLVEANGDRTVVRLVQKSSDVKIEGAEVSAIVDSQGSMNAVHSSMIEKPKVTTKPELTRDEALKKALSILAYDKPELGEGINDGLLIGRKADGQAELVWQFSVMDAKDLTQAAEIQIIAAGARKGEVFKNISLSQDASATKSKWGKIRIYDASRVLLLPTPVFRGIQVLQNGHRTMAGLLMPKVTKEAAWDADGNLAKVRQFYFEQFGRQSYDNKGSSIYASVNVMRRGFFDVLRMKENAAWMGPFKMFIIGAGGKNLGGLAKAIDVLGHEFTHAVATSTCNLTNIGQSGGLNESVADVFGVFIKHHYLNTDNPFLVGDTVLRGELAERAKAIRNMLEPAKDGLDEQPETMADIPEKFSDSCQPASDNDNCGVHFLNGVPNRAAALIIKRLGFNEQTYKFFYNVMTQRLVSGSKFADYRDAMLAECEASLPSACPVVQESFAAVGL